jgi:hypothetical protein
MDLAAHRQVRDAKRSMPAKRLAAQAIMEQNPAFRRVLPVPGKFVIKGATSLKERHFLHF